MLELNSWFFVQLANFLITIVVLNLILVRPIRRVLSKRAELMAGQASEIESFTTSADSKLKNYTQALDEARKQASAARSSLREDGLVKEKSILEAAGLMASESLKSARAEVAVQSKAALEAMLVGVPEMAAKAAGKILGKTL
jgi:F-type H+-transporting ATPase subunit b